MSPRFRISTLSFAGLLSLMALLNGCAGNSGSLTTTTTTTPPTTGTTGSLTTGGAANVYALNDISTTGTLIPNDVLEFPAASSGNSAVPSVTIPLSTLEPAGVALDGSGQLYVTGTDDTTGVPSVSVYAAGSGAGASPLRTFLTNASFEPIGIAVTSAGQAYVLEGEYDQYGDVLATQIEVFAPPSTSALPVTYTITGSATGLIDPQDIAVDTAGNVYVANYEDNNVSQILQFAAGANGNVAPSGVITFNNEITGIAVDSSANIYVAEVTSGGSASIVEYAAGGFATPVANRTISGSTAGLTAAGTGAIRVDAAGNIWLIQQSPDTSSTPATYIEAWPSGANGNVAPGVVFSAPSLLNPNGAFAVR